MKNDLTTLANFKAWVNFQGVGSGDDAYLQKQISDISQKVLDTLGRPSLFRTTYMERYDGLGKPRLMLRQWPAISIASLIIDGVTVPQAQALPPNTSGFVLEPYIGAPPGRQQVIDLVAYNFCRALQNVAVTYDAGYCITGEAWAIPATPYQITAKQYYGPAMQDDGLTINGVAGVAVAANPATGQYVFAPGTGLYTFAAADTGKAVVLNYSYTPSNVEGCVLDMLAEKYAYRQRVGKRSESLGGVSTNSYDTTIMTKYIMANLRHYARRTYV